MKSAVAILAVFLITFSALAMADTSTADEDTFDIGDYTYKILNNTEVDLYEYNNSSTATTVDIPATVIHGSEYKVTQVSAWFNNDVITTINIGSNVSKLNVNSFSQASKLLAFDVAPGNVNFGDDGAVLYEKNDLGDYYKLFFYPRGITDTYFEVPSSVSEIGYCSFSGSRVSTIELHEGIIKIDSYAFTECSNLTNIRTGSHNNTFPNSLSIIGANAFSCCHELKSMKLPDELSFIGTGAFEATGLTQVLIPYGVEYIGDGAFSDCPGITKFDSDNLTYQTDESGVLFMMETGGTSILIAYPAASTLTEYNIPEYNRDIAMFAFAGCQNLETVYLTESCISIPEYAFYGCTSLKNINLDGILTVGMSSFQNCENLSSVNFGDKITYIGLSAFKNTALETLDVPSSVHDIEYGAFSDCTNLKEVTFKEGSTATVDWNVFLGDYALTEVTIESPDVKLMQNSLSTSDTEDKKTEVNVHVVKGYSVPDDASNEYTTLYISVIGERPYPWENWIGVFFCAMVVIGILLVVREV